MNDLDRMATLIDRLEKVVTAMAAKDGPRWLSYEQATAYCSLGRTVLEERVRTGELRSSLFKKEGAKKGRRLIDRHSLDSLIEAGGGIETARHSIGTPRWLTFKDATIYCGYSRRTLQRRINEKLIRASLPKAGHGVRLDRLSIDALMESGVGKVNELPMNRKKPRKPIP